MDKEEIYSGQELLSPGQEFWVFCEILALSILVDRTSWAPMENVPHVKQCKSRSGLTRTGFVAQ